MRLPFLLSIAFLFVLTASLGAQIRLGEFGLTASGRLGAAGSSCWGVSCTAHSLDVARGDSLQLTLRAPFGAPFAIALSLPPLGCVRFPFVEHALVLDPGSMVTLVVGTVDRHNTMRYCYDGFSLRGLSIPATLPVGAQFGMQALAVIPTVNGQRPALSAAILATLR